MPIREWSEDDRLREKLFKHWEHTQNPVEGEHLYNALGKTVAGRLLSVFFIRKLGSKALIVTARDMNESERKRYGKK